MEKNSVYNRVFNANKEELEELCEKAKHLSYKYFNHKLKVYYPNKFFPTISITGTKCTQNCLYCNGHYLEAMQQISTPKRLKQYALHLSAIGGKGMLISGGFNKESVLPVEPFLEVIAEIKKETNLIINLHSGLVNKSQAKALYDARVDVISYDLIVDDQIINEIIRNGKRAFDYLQSYEILRDVGLNVVPQICLGLYYGQMKGVIEAIQTILRDNPKIVVFILFIPTKGTSMQNYPIIDPISLQKTLIFTRLLNPKIEQALGCMRVRLIDYEKKAIACGINRIAIPKKSILNYTINELKLDVETIYSCCAT